MIHLGLDDTAKGEIVTRYREEHEIKKVYVLSPSRFAPSWAAEHMTDPATLEVTLTWLRKAHR